MTLVVERHVAHLQIPLAHVRPDDGEARVVDDASLVVRQWYRRLVQPRHLPANPSQPSAKIKSVFSFLRQL